MSGGLQGYGVPNQGNQMWNSGGQYSAAELSGWGTNLNASGLQSANLDAAALLATQVSLLLGSGPVGGASQVSEHSTYEHTAHADGVAGESPCNRRA